MMKAYLAGLLSILMAAPATAQQAPRDWDIVCRDDVTAAFTNFNAGIAIAVRCIDGAYEALLLGMPPAPEDEAYREIRVAFGEDELRSQTWDVGAENTVLVSSLPAPFARKLREGGRLQIQVPQGALDGRNLLYDLTLPASSASIDATLEACDRPLIDPRDAELADLPEDGLPEGLTWRRRPRPEYPMGGGRGGSTYVRGFAVLTCLTKPDGGLRDCVVETEHPNDGGFGEAALRGARGARVANVADPDTPLPTARLMYRSRFLINGYETPAERRSIRGQRGGERDRPGSMQR